MKICVAQTRPVKGEIEANIAHHRRWIELAATNGAKVIIFPELSLTGYEPSLAADLATTAEDERFDGFQQLSDACQLTIGVGVPTRNADGICITMVIFQPHRSRITYSKKYLHPDEEAFFVSGPNFARLEVDNTGIALAVCYELSVPEHTEAACQSGAKVYVASVAKSAAGVEKAAQTLANLARDQAMTVLMSNCLGPSDDFEGAGNTSVWNSEGELVAQLNDTDEGLLIVDTDTQEVIKKTLPQ